MRSLSRLTALFAIFLGSAFVFAQANGPQSSTPPTGGQQTSSQISLEERLQNLSRQLGLTDAQKEKIRPIMLDGAKEVDALQADTSLTREQRFAKFKQIHEGVLAKMRPVLTEAQQKRLDLMMQQMHTRPAGGGPQNRRDTQKPQ